VLCGNNSFHRTVIRNPLQCNLSTRSIRGRTLREGSGSDATIYLKVAEVPTALQPFRQLFVRHVFSRHSIYSCNNVIDIQLASRITVYTEIYELVAIERMCVQACRRIRAKNKAERVFGVSVDLHAN